jgi:hypothetical protein
MSKSIYPPLILARLALGPATLAELYAFIPKAARGRVIGCLKYAIERIDKSPGRGKFARPVYALREGHRAKPAIARPGNPHRFLETWDTRKGRRAKEKLAA